MATAAGARLSARSAAVGASSPGRDAEPAGRVRHARLAVLRNFLWLTADKALAVAVGLLVFGLIARHYGPVGSGHYAYGVALLQVTLGGSLLVSATAVLPRMCRQRHGFVGSIANVWAVRLVGAAIATLVATVWSVMTISDPGRLAVTLAIVATAPLVEPFYIAVTYWQSRNDNRPPVVIRSLGLVLRGAIVAAAVYAGAPVWVPALAWLAEAMLAAALQTASLRGLAPIAQFRRAITRQRMRAFLLFGVRFQAGLLLMHLFLRSDRLMLAPALDRHEFGIYATAMQLVEVWLQIANIVGVSIGPAFLYRALSEGRPWHWYARVYAGIGAIGASGIVGAAVLGPIALRLVFGAQFTGSQPYLVAGTAFAALYFVDQAVEMNLTASNRPHALALKWAVAVGVSFLVLHVAAPVIGAYAGPVALSLGLTSGWVVVGLDLLYRRRRDARGTPRARARRETPWTT